MIGARSSPAAKLLRRFWNFGTLVVQLRGAPTRFAGHKLIGGTGGRRSKNNVRMEEALASYGRRGASALVVPAKNLIIDA